MGRQDAASRLQAALLALAVARVRDDHDGARRAGKAVTSLRELGFANLAREAFRFAPGLAASRRLRVRLAGAVRVDVGGREVGGWRSRKAREALLTLAAAPEGGLRRDELVEAVWPGREPGRGRTLLRTALAEIRRVLEPDRPAGEPSAYVTADRERVVLVADVDLRDARRHAAAGRHARRPRHPGRRRRRRGAGHPRATPAPRRPACGCGRRPRSAATARRTPDERAGAYEAVLAVEPWRHDLAEEVVALWYRAGDAERARAADQPLARWQPVAPHGRNRPNHRYRLPTFTIGSRSAGTLWPGRTGPADHRQGDPRR